MQHRDLAAGRWWTLSLFEQLGNVGSEISQTIRWSSKNRDLAKGALYRALELLDLTLADPEHRKSKARLREIARTREVVVDFFAGSNDYGSTAASLQKYFDAYALAARRAAAKQPRRSGGEGLHRAGPLLGRGHEPAMSELRRHSEQVGAHARGPIIAISFAGLYPRGSDGNNLADEMCTFVQTAMAKACPAALVLDLTGLEYTWGDAIGTLAAPLHIGQGVFLPAAIVATGPTARALAPLLDSRSFLGLAGVELFETRPQAMKHLDERLAQPLLVIAPLATERRVEQSAETAIREPATPPASTGPSRGHFQVEIALGPPSTATRAEVDRTLRKLLSSVDASVGLTYGISRGAHAVAGIVRVVRGADTPPREACWDYGFSCQQLLETMQATFNEAGPWTWELRDSAWYGDYLNTRPEDGLHVRILSDLEVEQAACRNRG